MKVLASFYIVLLLAIILITPVVVADTLRSKAYSHCDAAKARLWQGDVRDDLLKLLRLDVPLAARTAWPLNVKELSSKEKSGVYTAGN